jgi:hypothetical protein
MSEEKKVELEDMTQSPIEIELKGKKFKLGPIGFIDFGDFAQYVKGQKIKLCDYIADKDVKLQMIEKIMNEPVNLDAEYGTVNGISYMAWKAIQKYQKDVSLKDINDLIDLDNFEQVSVILNNLGGAVKNGKTAKAKENR